MKQHNFSLVSDAQLGSRQCLDEVTAVAMGPSVTFSTFFVFGRDRTCSQSAVLRRHSLYIFLADDVCLCHRIEECVTRAVDAMCTN